MCYRAAPLVVNASFVIYAVWRGAALATLCKNLWTIMEMLGLLHGIMQFEECVQVEVARHMTKRTDYRVPTLLLIAWAMTGAK